MKKTVIKALYPILVYIVWLYTRLLFLTCKIKRVGNKEAIAYIQSNKPVLLLGWHSRFLVFPSIAKELGSFSALVSSHRDGNALKKYLEMHPIKVVQGSSRRGALAAVKQLMHELKQGQNLVITPDGPLGPRFKVKGSIVSIIKKSQVPFTLMCYSATKCIKLNTWDKFIIPLPFSTILIDFSKLYYDSEDLTNSYISEKMNAQMKKLDKSCNLKIEY